VNPYLITGIVFFTLWLAITLIRGNREMYVAIEAAKQRAKEMQS